MFGYATSETDGYMPLALDIAIRSSRNWPPFAKQAKR